MSWRRYRTSRQRIRPWREWTLRTRMVLAIAALAAVGLLVTDFTGLTLLHKNLVGRVDGQLVAQSHSLQHPEEPHENPQDQHCERATFGPDSRQYLFHTDGAEAPDPCVQGTPPGGPDLGGFASVRRHSGDGPYTVEGRDGPWRVLVTRMPNSGDYVVSAVSLADVENTQHSLLAIDAAVTGAVLLAIGLAAASVVRLGLRPLTRMERIAEKIAQGDLAQRVTDADPHTESGRLGRALNAMLGRIEAAISARTRSEQRLRQFLADASHELRTPLTSIRGFAELYRRGGAPPGPRLDEAMGRIEAEVGRMGLLVDDLLLLARLDEERPLERKPVDLLEVAADAVRDAHLRDPTRHVMLGPLAEAPEGDPDRFDPVTVLGDEGRIRQVVANLVANALQHTPQDAGVSVRVGRLPAPDRRPGEADPAPVARVGERPDPAQPAAALEVSDTGPGLGEADAQRVFERLYRVDPSRSRRHGGAGLGLSIVAAIVRSHGGQVELWTAPGEGTRFRVSFPLHAVDGFEPDFPDQE